eukprot:scaffold252268_cov45-Attheya_sp.AAC.2
MLAEMCPGHKLNDVKCIFGDGILDNSLNDDSDLNAAILGDSYHLISTPNSVWRGLFKSHFSSIENDLYVMMNTNSETEFDNAYASAKRILSGNVSMIEYLDDMAKKRNTYSKYIVGNLPGSLRRHGQTHAE